jgi:hypothetical protein
MEFTTTPEAKMTRSTPTTTGTWNRIASKTYRHLSGIEVAYDHNAWNWQIVGGANDGSRYQTLTVAQHYATR